ncbi:MAG TPA: hypothetical protein VD994_15760, partial [Prosthecobacter sp.]|nr:hypothetical protein [Prosthecobacter sp.]
MKLIFSGGLVVPTRLAGPAWQADVNPTVAPAAEEPEPETASEPELPAGLPRAEDFDSGDPDIMSSSESEAAQLAGARSPGRRLLGALPWKRRVEQRGS